jgi:hypothetical protein
LRSEILACLSSMIVLTLIWFETTSCEIEPTEPKVPLQ